MQCIHAHMRAITVHGVHARNIVFRGKWVENRTWAPHAKHFGTRIAVHAGSTAGDSERGLPRSCVLGTVRLLGVVSCEAGRIKYAGCADLTRALAHAAFASDWFGGPIGWVLVDVAPLEMQVPCKGALGLWTLKPEVVSQLSPLPVLPSTRADRV